MIPDKHSLSDEYAAAVRLGHLTELDALQKQFGSKGESREAKPWPLQSLESIKGLDLPPREPIIGCFNSASVNIVAAMRGSGKTMWMTEIAESVASGNPFCQWESLQQGKVILIQLDMPIQAVQKRAFRRHWHEDFHYITRWHFQRAEIPSPDIGNPDHHDEVISQLSDYRMVIFDTRRAIQPPGQGAASNMWHPSYWLASAPVRHALADAGVCVVFLDHLNNAGEVKDTKAIEDDADAVITLKDSDKGTQDLCFHVELSKDRDNVGDECYFEFDGENWNQFSDGSVKQAVATYRRMHTIKQTAEKFGVSERTVKNYVRDVRKEERKEQEALGKLTG